PTGPVFLLPSTTLFRSSATQSCGLHFLRGTLRVIARLWTMCYTATGHLRFTDRTLTSPAGTFLTKRLTSTARNFRASFCRVGPLACSSKLRVDNLVHQSNVGFDIKEFSWQIHRYFLDSHVVRLPSLHREPTQRGHGDQVLHL